MGFRVEVVPREAWPDRILKALQVMNLVRCRANMAHIRQSRPDCGLGFQVKVLKFFPLRSEAALDFLACHVGLQGYLAHTTTPTPLGPP